MKRIRRNEVSGNYEWDDGKGMHHADISGMFTSDYRDSDWRDIEDIKFNPETGDLVVVVKEAPKVPTLKEAAEHWKYLCMTKQDLATYRNSDLPTLQSVVNLCDALDRELANPTKPSKYREELVDELLDIGLDNSSVLSELVRGSYKLECNARAGEILRALLKQRDAANAS